jgi:hypothetical protein
MIHKVDCPDEELIDDTLIEEEIKVDAKFVNRFNSIKDDLICVEYVDDDLVDASALIEEELQNKEDVLLHQNSVFDQNMSFEVPPEFVK